MLPLSPNAKVIHSGREAFRQHPACPAVQARLPAELATQNARSRINELEVKADPRQLPRSTRRVYSNEFLRGVASAAANVEGIADDDAAAAIGGEVRVRVVWTVELNGIEPMTS
jgi:hypothetical protein